jgi:hypothetical protein
VLLRALATICGEVAVDVVDGRLDELFKTRVHGTPRVKGAGQPGGGGTATRTLSLSMAPSAVGSTPTTPMLPVMVPASAIT